MDKKVLLMVAVCWSALVVLWMSQNEFSVGGDEPEKPTLHTPNARKQLTRKGTPVPHTGQRAVQCLNVSLANFDDLLTHKERTPVADLLRNMKERHPNALHRWGPSTTGPKVVMTYSACHGSLSQHFGHLSALTIAKGLQPDVVVLPHARTRKTFQSRNLLGEKDVNKTNIWTEVPLSAVYDIRSFEEYFSKLGIKATTFPSPPGPVTLPGTYKGFDTHWHVGLPGKFGLPEKTPVVGLRYKRRRPLYIWLQILNRQISRYHREENLIVDLGCTDILIGANPNFTAIDQDIDSLTSAHESLRVAGYLHDAAIQVREQLPVNYTSVHLRIERDMIADSAVGRWWRAHLRAKAAFLDPIKEIPTFVASGIFEYMSEEEQRSLLAPYILTHKMYRACGVDEIPNDIRPWVDFFVLLGGGHFQGHEYSVLTWLVIQQRLLFGRGLDQHSLVKKKGPPRNPQCCENDRCLTYLCALRDDGPLIDFRVSNKTVETDLAPISFEN
eukprot:TRINITY_DN15730_c0_g1_i1.p1 TRINITY_DN15730_c0_g1~~TRINITY_DN15730_c0_g1_i1.p1  ORF type:complete len:524 (+),score=49.41 TRINITY_DN15730_c0_g1_i1:79-1572(+)